MTGPYPACDSRCYVHGCNQATTCRVDPLVSAKRPLTPAQAVTCTCSHQRAQHRRDAHKTCRVPTCTCQAFDPRTDLAAALKASLRPDAKRRFPAGDER